MVVGNPARPFYFVFDFPFKKLPSGESELPKGPVRHPTEEVDLNCNIAPFLISTSKEGNKQFGEYFSVVTVEVFAVRIWLVRVITGQEFFSFLLKSNGYALLIPLNWFFFTDPTHRVTTYT